MALLQNQRHMSNTGEVGNELEYEDLAIRKI